MAHTATKYEKFMSELRLYFETIDSSNSPLSNNHALCPVVITNCNGTGNWCFSDATIEYNKQDGCTLEWWFINAVNRVHLELLCTKSDMNDVQRKAFDSLLQFVNEIETHKRCLSYLIQSKSTPAESEVVGILALHLFAALVDGDYKVEGRTSRSCAVCRHIINTGNTSFGNKDIWHGIADIAVAKSIVKVDFRKDDTDQDLEEDDVDKNSPVKDRLMNGEEPHVEFLKYCKADAERWSYIIENLTEAAEIKVQSEVLAQTIVNAFCVAREHQSLSNKFIPSFLVKGSEVSIHMYNCDQDKLLTSEPLPLWRTGIFEDHLNINTILYIWMALHSDAFDTEKSHTFPEQFPCSRFKTAVGSRYQIFKHGVSSPLDHSGDKSFMAYKEGYRVNPNYTITPDVMAVNKKLRHTMMTEFTSSSLH